MNTIDYEGLLIRSNVVLLRQLADKAGAYRNSDSSYDVERLAADNKAAFITEQGMRILAEAAAWLHASKAQ